MVKATPKVTAFIQFDTEAAAKEAIEKVNGMELNDKVVYVGPFQRRAERGTTETKFNNVFVKNLGDEVTDEELRKSFRRLWTGDFGYDFEGRGR